jgi:hypothetical protein
VELDRSYVTERLTVNGRTYTYRQVEGSFSQPNAGVCQHMLSWAQRVSAPGEGDATTTVALPGVIPPPATNLKSQQTEQPETTSNVDGGDGVEAGGNGAAADVSSEPSQQQQQQPSTHARHDHELLELYCGNGNFTLPLAANFRRVIATELAKPSVEAARWGLDVWLCMYGLFV